MSRIPRLVLNAATFLTLLLCIASLLLWTRSYWRTDSLGYYQSSTERNLELKTTAGRANLILWAPSSTTNLNQAEPGFSHSFSPAPTPPNDVIREFDNYPHIMGRGSFAGFAWLTADGNPHGDFPFGPVRVISIPYWSLATLTAAIPLLRLQRWVRARLASKRAGKCRQCGYDLRASPDRCPECGAVVDPCII